MRFLSVALSCLACGGESVGKSGDGKGGSGAIGGNGAIGGSDGGACGGQGSSSNPSCPGAAPAPEFTLLPRCTDFAPSLSTGTLDWVGAEPVCGKTLVGHRFNAPPGLANGCGYELVIALPGLTFAGSGTYDFNAWWAYENGASRLIAAVLRRKGETLPELVVAEATGGDLVSGLSAPLAIEPSGPACDECWKEGGAADGLVAPALSEGSAPLACNSELGVPALLRCRGADRSWNVVIYCAAEASTEYPVVYGPAETLAP